MKPLKTVQVVEIHKQEEIYHWDKWRMSLSFQNLLHHVQMSISSGKASLEVEVDKLWMITFYLVKNI